MSSINTIQDLMDSPLLNASSIYRFSGNRFTVKESVADHIGECLGIALALYNEYPIFSIKHVIISLSIHDLGETLTGDFTRPVKYYSSEMKNMVDKIEESLLKKYVGDELLDLIINAKKRGVKEDAIVVFIDVLQAATKLARELMIQKTQKLITDINYSIDCLRNIMIDMVESYYPKDTGIYKQFNKWIIGLEQIRDRYKDTGNQDSYE